MYKSKAIEAFNKYSVKSIIQQTIAKYNPTVSAVVIKNTAMYTSSVVLKNYKQNSHSIVHRNNNKYIEIDIGPTYADFANQIPENRINIKSATTYINLLKYSGLVDNFTIYINLSALPLNYVKNKDIITQTYLDPKSLNDITGN